MTLSKRERTLLISLALVAGFAGLRSLWLAASAPGRAAGGAGGGSARRGANVGAPLPGQVVVLRRDLLDPTPKPFTVGRDPFRYGPPPPPPGPSAEELDALRRAAEERQRQARDAAARPVVPQPPQVSFSYLGSFGRDDARIAVLFVTATKEVVNARVGDIVQGVFVIDQIGFESIDIRFVGFPDAPARRLAIEG